MKLTFGTAIRATIFCSIAIAFSACVYGGPRGYGYSDRYDRYHHHDSDRGGSHDRNHDRDHDQDGDRGDR